MRIMRKKPRIFANSARRESGYWFLRTSLGIILGFLGFDSLVLANGPHEEGEEHEVQVAETSWEEQLTTASLSFMFLAGFLLVGLIILSWVGKKKMSEKVKGLIFAGMALPVLWATLFSAGTTIYLNLKSESRGPVHWHADYEMRSCNYGEIDLQDPQGLTNRVGSPLVHEHGDKRIHIEGRVDKLEKIVLPKILQEMGISLEENSLKVVTSPQGQAVYFKNGDLCLNGKMGVVQVFVYKTIKGQVFQEKLFNFQEYMLTPETRVPPGDCLIIEFDEDKEQTEMICQSYRLAIEKGEVKFGRD